MNFLHPARAVFVFAMLHLIPAAVSNAAAAEKTSASAAADGTRPAPELVISKGTFELRGQRLPATLRNIIDALIERYPRANITLVGAEDVIVGDVTLRWGRRVLNSNEMLELPLHGVIAALRAASKDRFTIEAFSSNDFMLAGKGGASSTRIVEVFRLGQLLKGPNFDPGLQRQIDASETEMAVLSKRLAPGHPQMTELSDRVEILKRMQTRNKDSSADNAEKLLDDIQKVVLTTLKDLKPDDAKPDFKYHPGTGLLVVIGSDEAIEIARKVINALQ